MSGTFPDGPYARVCYSYEFVCFQCKKTETQHFAAYRGECAAAPGLPKGWRIVDGLTVCHQHQTIVLVDGKVVG